MFKRQLFTYWHQGFDHAPAIVDACISSFKRNHEDWDLICLDSESVQRWLEPFPIREGRWQELSLAHQSDLIRTQLLIRHGGVWADPTVFFTGSLESWLPVENQSSLFLFSRPGPDRLISNWFIAASPGNRLLEILLQRLCEYWDGNDFVNLAGGGQRRLRLLSRLLNRNPMLTRLWLSQPVRKGLKVAPYMIYHYLFNDLVASDPECREVWRKIPKVSAHLPHRLQDMGLLEPMASEAEEVMTDHQVPLFKLTWKLGSAEVPKDSILSYLLGHGHGGLESTPHHV
ncbi:MAG: capsular polysaccharide synthesis protein [Wenzhouxiangella sp.]